MSPEEFNKIHRDKVERARVSNLMIKHQRWHYGYAQLKLAIADVAAGKTICRCDIDAKYADRLIKSNLPLHEFHSGLLTYIRMGSKS